MINYLRLRWKIYRHDIKQMTAAMRQFLMFYSALMFISLPSLILLSLISLSVIADSQTAIDQRITYQWLYLAFLYFLIRVQKKAILGEKNQHYLNSLPVENKLIKLCSALLTLIAGNLPLLAPLFLLTYIPDVKTFFEQGYFPLFTLMVLSITWQVLNRNSMPWIGLLLAPLLLKLSLFILSFLAINPEHLFMNAINLNSLWLLIFCVEAYIKPFWGMAENLFTLKSYWRMRWLAIFKKPTNALMRVFITSLLLSLIAYGQYKIGIKVNVGLQIAATGLIALIIGSYQFNNEKFYQAHQYYLNTLLTQKFSRYYLDTIPMIFLALMASIVMWQWLGFSAAMVLLLPISTLITIKSVSQFERNFFILPFTFHGLVVFVYVMA